MPGKKEKKGSDEDPRLWCDFDESLNRWIKMVIKVYFRIYKLAVLVVKIEERQV